MITCTLVSHVFSALHWSSVASDFKMFTEAISCAIVLVWHQFEKLQRCANRFFMKEVGTFLFIFSELILFQGLPVPNIMPQQLITCHFPFLLYFGVKICRCATSYMYIYYYIYIHTHKAVVFVIAGQTVIMDVLSAWDCAK